MIASPAILDKIEKKSPGRRCVLVVVGLAYRSSETLVWGSAVRRVGPFAMMDNASWDFLSLQQDSWAWISRPPRRSFLSLHTWEMVQRCAVQAVGVRGAIDQGRKWERLSPSWRHGMKTFLWRRYILAAQSVLHFPPNHCPWKYWSSKKNSCYRRRHSCSTLLLPKHWHGFASCKKNSRWRRHISCSTLLSSKTLAWNCSCNELISILDFKYPN